MAKYANVPDKNQAPGKKPKIFVLDTNVILHDYKSIRKFQDNDIVIPMAVVEELDKFKKGTDALAYNARGFVREIDRLSGERLFDKGGVQIGKGLGKVKIELNHPFPPALKECFKDDIQDHRIIATAMWVRDNNPDRFVALVTKDINMRMKAKAVGMMVQDYLTDRIEEAKVEENLKEVQILDKVPSELLQDLAYGPTCSIDWKAVCQKEPAPNQLYKFRWQSGPNPTTSCARYDRKSGKIVLVKDRYAYGIKPRNDEQSFALEACLNKDIPLVALTGGAGTGKTLIALAAALEQEKDFDQIIISRPTVVLGGQDIGFLPGDQKSKMSPYVQPLMDNLNVIRKLFKPGSKQALHIEGMLKEEKILITPLAYIRGRSLGKVFFIIDEAQNLTPHEIKTIITRAGEGTKMIFTGDVYQIDQPYLDKWSNGLTHLSDKMAGQELFEHVNLRKGERSELSEMAAKLL